MNISTDKYKLANCLPRLLFICAATKMTLQIYFADIEAVKNIPTHNS